MPLNRREKSERAAVYLSAFTGLEPEELLNASRLLDKYNTFEIPKACRPGQRPKFRKISAPAKDLKSVQRVLLHTLLYRFPVSDCAYGGVMGRSLIDGVIKHMKARTILKIDFKNAFPTPSESLVVDHLFQLFYKYFESTKDSEWLLEHMAILVGKLVTFNGLPQGAPTSPYLLNLLCLDLDREIANIAEEHSLVFTRYVDDITISTSGNFIPQSVIDKIFGAIARSPFEVNRAKTRFSSSRAHSPEITGVVLKGDRTGLRKKKIEEMRALFYQATFADSVSRERVFGHLGWIVMACGGNVPARLHKPLIRLLETHFPEKADVYKEAFGLRQ